VRSVRCVMTTFLFICSRALKHRFILLCFVIYEYQQKIGLLTRSHRSLKHDDMQLNFCVP
jgi:hypothetical protein